MSVASMHLSRKLFHASGLVIVAVWSTTACSREFVAWTLTAITVISAAFDFARHRSAALQAFFERSFAVILDEKDMRGFNGTTLYFAGCAMAVWFTAPPAAKAGIIALALGDSMAAIIGSSVRSPRWGRISLAGSGSCFLAAALGARVWFAWPASLAAGTTAMLLEAFSGSKLDNLTMPIGTALVLQLWR